MPTPNELFASVAAVGSVAVTGVIGYLGVRSKGADQRLAKETASYDNLQEDLKECRAELSASETRRENDRKRYIEEQDRADANHRLLMLEQLGRHDMYSLFRSCFTRLADAGLEYKDLNARLDKIKETMGKA